MDSSSSPSFDSNSNSDSNPNFSTNTFTLPPLLRLPSELHSIIGHHLEQLSSRIIYRKLTSKLLFPENNHRTLLSPQWRYSMAEARQASQDLRNQNLTPQSVLGHSLPAENGAEPQAKTSNSVFWKSSELSTTPKPPPPIQFDDRISKKEASPEEEAGFFVNSLKYLIGEEKRNEIDDSKNVNLRVLSLIGWFGIDASLVLEMLLTNSYLEAVETLVKTERLDLEIWRPIDLNQKTNLSSSRDSKRREAFKTQATFRVGSRFQDENLKGSGLRIGYECWCFVQFPIKLENSHDDDDDDSIQSSEDVIIVENGDGSQDLKEIEEKDENQDPLFKLNRNFHIIIQGRYEVKDAMMLEDTLDKSFIICNRCKNEIFF